MIRYTLIFIICLFFNVVVASLAQGAEKVSAFLRVKDEIKTIEACLNSIDGVFDKIVIIHSNEKDDGSVAFMNEWCKYRPTCEIHEYPYRVIPAHQPEYKTKYDYNNSLAAYYNFGLKFFEPEEWVVKIDADQVYIKDRLKDVISFIRDEADLDGFYGIKGYNTFAWKGYLVKYHHLPINGYQGDSFIVKRKYIKKFKQTEYYELLKLTHPKRINVFDTPVWFHFFKNLKRGETVKNNDSASNQDVLFLLEEERRLFNENILPYLENSPYRGLKLKND